MRPLPPVASSPAGSARAWASACATRPSRCSRWPGEPFLIHQLRLLAAHGAREVVLCVGYLGEQIESRIGDERFGIAIRYSYDAPGLDGTLGAIRRALPLLGERFLVLYGDTYLRIDYARRSRDAGMQSGLPAVMTVLRNEGRWDTSNVLYRDGHGARATTSARPRRRCSWIDYGLGGLDRGALDRVRCTEGDLAELYRQLAAAASCSASRRRALLRDRHARGARGDRCVPARAEIDRSASAHLCSGPEGERAQRLLTPDSGLLGQGVR